MIKILVSILLFVVSLVILFFSWMYDKIHSKTVTYVVDRKKFEDNFTAPRHSLLKDGIIKDVIQHSSAWFWFWVSFCIMLVCFSWLVYVIVSR